MTTYDTGHVIRLSPFGPMWEGAECDELERQLLEKAQAGRLVIVDLSEVSRLTAHCLGILAHAQDVARANGGQVALCGPTELQRWLLHETKLDHALAVFANPASALEALNAGPRAVA